jgi:outer membrane lipoprotein-sorting protein
MKKHVITILLAFAAAASTADGAALQEFSKRMSAMKGFALNYVYTLQNYSGVQSRQSGSMLVGGAKYRIEMENTLIVCDGAARYVYLKAENEIVIETPNPLRDGLFADPSALFTINHKDFKVKESNDAANISLVLTPKQDGQPYEKIALTLNKTTYYPVKIVYYGNDGGTTTLIISNFKANILPPPDDVSFDTKRYPSAEIVDMR